MCRRRHQSTTSWSRHRHHRVPCFSLAALVCCPSLAVASLTLHACAIEGGGHGRHHSRRVQPPALKTMRSHVRHGFCSASRQAH